MSQNASAPSNSPGSTGPSGPSRASAAAPVVFRLAALFTFLAVAMGAVVCATKSGAACPTWPGCRPDDIAPGWHLSPVIEFSHRVVAVSVGPLVLAAAALSTRLRTTNVWLRILPLLALGGAIASGVFGRLVVVSTLPTWLGGVDLFCALAAMIVTGVTAVLATAPDGVTRGLADRTARLASAGIATLVVLHVTGIFAAGTGSYTRCMGWPLWRTIADDAHPALQAVRLGLAGLGAVLVVATAVSAARTERLRRWGILVGVLFAAEMLLGVAIRTGGLGNGIAAAYSVVAVALLWGLALLAAVAGTARVATVDGPEQPARPRELAEPGLR